MTTKIVFNAEIVKKNGTAVNQDGKVVEGKGKREEIPHSTAD